MRKLMILAAMLAMTLLVAAPVMADVIASNNNEQNAEQFQVAPGGDATYDPGDDCEFNDDDDGLVIILDDDGCYNSVDNDCIYVDGIPIYCDDDDDDDDDNDVTVTGGDGGTQKLNQTSVQNATANA